MINGDSENEDETIFPPAKNYSIPGYRRGFQSGGPVSERKSLLS
jgi:hypothetical protein